MKTKPDLSFWKLWNLSFGFFGVQIAYALQSANVSRIFTTIGADPHDLSYFWILPPLMGLVVQPIVGMMSDKTWNLAVGGAMLFGLIALMFLDTSINMAMQPFKMLVGDMVNEKQKARAYAIQSFLCNAGSVVGYIFPILFMWFGIKNTAPEGVVPDTVIWSFYIGAAILLICVFYSLVKIKEWPPKLYNEYNGIEEKPVKKEKKDVITLLRHAPATFWTVGVVQFFCWFAFLFLWTYATNTVAHNAFEAPTTVNYPGISYEGKDYQGKYLIANDSIIILDHGKKTEDFLSTHQGAFALTTADIVEKRADGTLDISATGNVRIDDASGCEYMTRTVLDATSPAYNEAGNWVGVLFAIQALGSVLWAVVLPRFRSRKFSYTLSLLLGAAGFFMTAFITHPYLLFVAFALIGCAWAAMLAWPFTILTNSLRGGNIGAYLGLFNCTICVPQIVAALVGGWILTMLSVPGELAPEYLMMAVAGVSLVIGSVCVFFIKEGPGKQKPEETPEISEVI